jgi:nucleotide-binding universal stress UspA family protein
MKVHRILVPTDFSADGEAAFACALELSRTFGASVHLLHVVENPLAAGAWSSEIYTAEIAGLQINLIRDATERLRGVVPAGATNVVVDVRSGQPAREIVAAARDLEVDVIVMGTHGRTGLSHAFMGSVAERVVRLAPCPVLTMRANEGDKGVAAA